MPTNLGFELIYKGNNVNIPLYPVTTIEQTLGWDIGEIYGPYTLTLSVNNWNNKQQIIQLEGVTEDDKVKCVKILTGDLEQIKVQNNAYNLLDSKIGIESLQNQIKFTCTNQIPTVDLTVEVMWTR